MDTGLYVVTIFLGIANCVVGVALLAKNVLLLWAKDSSDNFLFMGSRVARSFRGIAGISIGVFVIYALRSNLLPPPYPLVIGAGYLSAGNLILVYRYYASHKLNNN